MAEKERLRQYILQNKDKADTPEFQRIAAEYRRLQSTPEQPQQPTTEQPQQSMLQRATGAIRGAFNPQRENLPEYRGGSTPEQAMATEAKLGDPNATMGQDRFGNPTIVTERGTFYPNAPGLSLNDIRGFVRGTNRMSQESAPYIAGGAAVAPLKVGAQLATQGLIGLAQESITQGGRALQGDDIEWQKIATTPLFAMGGDAAGRLAYRVAAPVFAKIVGSQPAFRIVNPDGTLSDDAVRMLQRAGSTPDDFTQALAREADGLQRTGVLTPAQIERFNFMTAQGLDPTTAQITRSADDFQMQQELAKRSGKVRGRLEGQEAVIARAFDDRIMGAGGTTTGSPLSDAVINKATALDDEIRRLYQAARDVAPGEKNIRLESMVETLRRRAPDNELTGGLIRSIRGDLVERGVMDNNFRIRGRVDVDTAETIRQVLNSNFQSTNDKGRMIIRELKEQLDNDVLSVAGEDIFQQARRARADFSSQLRPDRVSRFDVNQRSLVEDIMDNTIKADDVFNQVALSNNWKPSDLNQLKRYLSSGSAEQAEQGLKAWSALRADTLDWIKQQSFKGPMDESGFQAISRANLDKALGKIGNDKLNVIFSPDEVRFLNDMKRLAELREPVRGTALGRGPSAQAVERLERSIMSRIPAAGPIYDFFRDVGMIRADRLATQQVLNPAAQTIQAITRNAAIPARQAAGAAGGLGAFAGTQQQPVAGN
jgi:hypothetical protein